MATKNQIALKIWITDVIRIQQVIKPKQERLGIAPRERVGIMQNNLHSKSRPFKTCAQWQTNQARNDIANL